ncbi:MAG TPA: 30S ribosomal protein S16, partial [Polyangiaceae bacterium]|nr:30S ribosomal protein S16 [Polyangiaceae bacterium]
VHIRLTRQGTKKKPFYRIIVADQRSRRDGRFIEKLGTFNPLDASGMLQLNKDRLAYWLGQGAQLSHTVDRLIKTAPVVASES